MLTQEELKRISKLAKNIHNAQKALKMVSGLNNHFHIGQINKKINDYNTELKFIVSKLK